MFGIGLMELAVIAVLGVLVVGPEKIPDLARQAAGLLKSARRASDTVRDELRANLGPGYADLELTDLNPRTLVRKHVLEAMRDERDDLNDIDDLDNIEDDDDPIDLDDTDSVDLEEEHRHQELAGHVAGPIENDLTERQVS